MNEQMKPENGPQKTRIVDTDPLSPEQAREALEQVENFVKKNIVSIADGDAKCIDGRLARGELGKGESKSIAFPGGDLGIVMALLEDYSPEEAVQLVLDFNKSKGHYFDYHTDSHAEHDHHHFIGCGHANASFEQNQFYAFPKEKIAKALEIIREKQASGEEMIREEVLVGDHGEEGIIINEDSEKSVFNYDAETGKQYFVYDKAAHKNYLQELVAFWKEKGVDIDFDKLWKSSEEQARATLALLGSSQGKPIFELRFNENDEPQLSYLGNAPTIEKK